MAPVGFPCVREASKSAILPDGLLAASAAFAGWSWFRPYAWSPDPAARCKIVGTQVTRDHSYFWVDVHLKVNPGTPTICRKPVTPETARGDRTGTRRHHVCWKRGPAHHRYLVQILAGARRPRAARSPSHLTTGNSSSNAKPGIPKLGATYRNFPTNHW